MTFDNHQISGRQCRRSLFIELFGISIFLITAAYTSLYGRKCFVMFLAGSVVALLIGWFYFRLSKHQTRSYGTQVAQAYSKTGWFVALLYTIRFTLRAGFLLSIFYHLMENYLIQEAGYSYIAIPLIVVSAYGAMKGREKRLRVMELLVWFVSVPFLLALCLALKEVHISQYYQEVTTSATGIQKILGGFIVPALFSNIEFILFLAPKIKETEKSVNNLLCPFALTVICNLAAMLLVVGVVGYENAFSLEQPLIRVLESVNFPGSFVRRLDILVLAFWIFAVFGVLSSCMFYSGRLLRDNCGYLKHRTYYPWELLLVMGFVYLFGFWCNKMENAFFAYVAYSVLLDIPLGMLLAWLTKKRSESFLGT